MLMLLAIIAVLQIAAGNAFKIQPRIMNGMASSVSDFSFFVKIEDPDRMCSATLISDRYIFSLLRKLQFH